jgi:hypothetical protein
MGGRELRAVLLFVLVSLAAGAAIRAWRWDGGPTLVERVRSRRSHCERVMRGMAATMRRRKSNMLR